MATGGAGGPEVLRDKGRGAARQALLIGNLVYGVWRAVKHGNPLLLLLTITMGKGHDVGIFLWEMLGALAFGSGIIAAAVGTMGGRPWGGRVLILLTALDLGLLLTEIPGVLGRFSLGSGLPFFITPLSAAGLLTLNVLFFLRDAPTAPGAGLPPSGGTVAVPGARRSPAVPEHLRWLLVAPILALLGWHWGCPIATTALAARRGAAAGGKQHPPRIRSVWALPVYDVRKQDLLALPEQARPAGFGRDAYRFEYAPRQGEAHVVVFGDNFRRVADQAEEDRRLTVKADGSPVALLPNPGQEDALAEFRIDPAVNGFLMRAPRPAVQMISGPTAASNMAPLDLGGVRERPDEWMRSEPRIHHVSPIDLRPGVITFRLLVSGLCRPLPDRPGWCTPGFVSHSGRASREVPCAVSVLGQRRDCDARHPNLLEVDAAFGIEDAVGHVELEVGDRRSNRFEIRVKETVESWNFREKLLKEYRRGVAASPSHAALGPAGLWIHLWSPALAAILFLLMRGWRGQVVLKSIAALTLPVLVSLVLVTALALAHVRLPPAVDRLIDSLSQDAIRDSILVLRSAAVGALVGLCLVGLGRRSPTRSAGIFR